MVGNSVYILINVRLHKGVTSLVANIIYIPKMVEVSTIRVALNEINLYFGYWEIS